MVNSIMKENVQGNKMKLTSFKGEIILKPSEQNKEREERKRKQKSSKVG